MAGLLTHLGVALAGFLAIYLAFYKSNPKSKIIYGLIFALGNIAPDLVDFGFLSIKMGSLDINKIMLNPLFHFLSEAGHLFSNWILFSLVIIAIAFLLYELRAISKKSFVAVIISVILLLIGVWLHLRFDVLIQERNHWI